MDYYLEDLALAQGSKKRFNFEFYEYARGGVSSFDKTRNALRGLRDSSENILLTLNEESQGNIINNFKTV